MAWKDVDARRTYKREWMRRYRAEHPEYIEQKRLYRRASLKKRAEYNKRWYHEHHTHARSVANRRYHRLRQDAAWRKKEKTWHRKYRENHPKKDREYYLRIKTQPDKYRKLLNRIRAWIKLNKTKTRAWQKRWDTKHPEKRRLKNRKRRAVHAQAAGTHELSQWLARVELYGWRCFYCRRQLSMRTPTMDHRIPLSRGGSHWPANLVPACKGCNSGKRDRLTYIKKGADTSWPPPTKGHQ